MKTVLVVGPDFVPSSMPPALRIRFLVRHLREFDWNPVVLSVDPRWYEHATDAENERLLPDGLEVIRTPAASPAWTRKIGIGDLGLRSLRQQWKAMRRICAGRKIDLLLLSVPPYPTMVLGRLAYRRLRIPYIVDYQDPWVTDYYLNKPKSQRPRKWRWSHAMAKILEPFALRDVAYITGVSTGTIDSVVRRYPWLEEIPTTEIPLGGEPADFEYLSRHRRANAVFTPGDGLVHLSYVGVCIPGMNATLRALFEAVRLGRRDDPTMFGRLRLHFVGTTYAPRAGEQVMPMARDMGLEQSVTEWPARVAYLDALQVLLDSDGVVMIGSDAPHYTASKLFPYVLAKKPLLAIFHQESSVVGIAAHTRAGQVVTFDNADGCPAKGVPAIRAWLTALLDSPGSLQPTTDWTAFEQYTTRAMSKRLAEALDHALARQGTKSAATRA
jgi:glycosyl transferase family 4